MTTSKLHLHAKNNIGLIIETLVLQNIISNDIGSVIKKNLCKIEDNPLEMLRELVLHNDTGYYEVSVDGIPHKITVRMEKL